MTLYCQHMITSISIVRLVLQAVFFSSHPHALAHTTPPSTSLFELLSPILSRAGLHDRCGSFTVLLAYMVLATDRLPNRPNRKDAASPADPNSPLQISAQPGLICHTHVGRKAKCASFCFQALSPSVFHFVFLSSLSLSVTVCGCT